MSNFCYKKVPAIANLLILNGPRILLFNKPTSVLHFNKDELAIIACTLEDE
jgi:hypothetical protein